MWFAVIIAISLFYFFALLQSSFFMHFDLFGAVPNLVFIFFFLLVFFEGKARYYQIIFLAIIAGIFLDISSYTYIGPSIVLLLIIGLLLKSVQSSLTNRKDNHPFIYFLSLFIIFLLAYDLLMDLYLYFLYPNKIAAILGIKIIFSLIYNSLIASIFFFIYKKCQRFTK